MESIREYLTTIVADAFEACGFDGTYGTVVASNRPDLGQFQCNGALPAARQYKTNPREISQQVVGKLSSQSAFRDISVAGPGFINLTVTDDFLAEKMSEVAADKRLGCRKAAGAERMIIDYGGANIAKPLHAGHLRPAIIGESLKRLARFLGHDVLGDVHLGDWGLPMGMVMSELQRRQPDLPYFDPDFSGSYPAGSPVTVAELEEIYPKVSARAQEDPEVMAEAQRVTFELQQDNPGYRALWEHIADVSRTYLEADYASLNVEFDLWLGESDAQEYIPSLVERLRADGFAHESNGALVIDVAQPDDKKEVPPLILLKSDGAVLYGTTDLATIGQRVELYNPATILYVVDNRQSDHFRQVFRSAYKTGMAPGSLKLEHIGNGTMNGSDGKPFKTRSGDVVRLADLIQMVTQKATQRMAEIGIAKDYGDDEKKQIARMVGVATLKFADLINHRSSDYIFDLDRFSKFDGCTGPYLLYTAVRIKSIIRKAEAQGLKPGPILPPESDVMRDLLLKIAELPDILVLSFEKRAPNHLCDYIYNKAVQFNRFYHEHHILRESDPDRQASWLGLANLSLAVLELAIELLGMEIPERM